MEHEDRLNELEARHALLEHTVQELSDALYEQQKSIDAMTKALHELSTKLKSGGGGLVDAADQEKPPHY